MSIKEKNGQLGSFWTSYSREVIASVLYFLNYFPTILWMWERWFARDTYYSHGILIPFFAIFLIWQDREKLKLIPKKESPWGLRLLIVGVVVHLLSSAFQVYFTSGFSMLIVLVGLILYFYGDKFLDRIKFPLVFLIFMVPLPMVLVTNISFNLKIFAAKIATMILNNMRIPALREGSIIKMRSAYVIVDDVCSGLRSLISLTAMASVFAHWLKGERWKKMFLFLSAIPIAVVTNVCRVVVLSAISEIWGPQYVEGLLHDLTGWMVFALAFLLLYCITKLLE